MQIRMCSLCRPYLLGLQVVLKKWHLLVQAYAFSSYINVVAQFVRRAERAGFKAIAITVDTPRLGRRESDIKNRLTISFYTILQGNSVDNWACNYIQFCITTTSHLSFFISMGLAVNNCAPGRKCFGINGGNFSASMNNISFVLPRMSILEAYYHNIPGIYSTKFPQRPIQPYDYTGGQLDNLSPLEGTYINEIPFNANVQIILQDTSAVAFENHPVHLHGYNFYDIGLGFGNYDPQTSYFNLVDPPMKNTIAVPAGGWAAIRFKADNPGVWYMHCHLEVHTTWGLATAFLVKNGRCPAECVIPPPKDLPHKCSYTERYQAHLFFILKKLLSLIRTPYILVGEGNKTMLSQ